ncbi:hypothetical protein L210DRAFT_3544429 [Boletus edulis BED1]|uniref:Uncharacterized protein n=1 Tax=Boletus edulis BED1 TaxID=1328754 RepID=A0AAD4BSL8_BOLED|nr:hypothetical protein L210DRAFT_3544429 [Boletus edulis BED1]
MVKSSIFISSFYIGINVENILYGIELALYFKTIHVLLSNRGAHKKSNVFYALFSTMMVSLITIWIATKAMFGQKIYPGGAGAYWDANIGVWYMDWATMMVIVLQLMTDALMIYRCRIIWNSYRVIIHTHPLGILVTWVTSLPGGDYYNGIACRLSLAYWSISVFLNTTLTCMICYRVVRHGRKVQEYLGYEYASLYFAVFSVVVESALPYTLSGGWTVRRSRRSFLCTS